MSKLIGIIGDTGHGKSMSIVVPPDGKIKKDEYNGLEPSNLYIVNLDGKPYPWETYIQKFDAWKKAFGNDFLEKRIFVPKTDESFMQQVKKVAKSDKVKNLVLDTLSFGMFITRMKKEKIKGYEKWTDLAVKYWELLEYFRNLDRDDLFVWCFFHSEEAKDREGNTIYRAKIEGKLLDRVPEKIMTNVFFATKKDDEYVFETQSNQTTAKNPPLLFDDIIPNSLKLIENVLR